MTRRLTRSEAARRGSAAEGPIYSAAMAPLPQPLQMLLLVFAGWVNRHQLDVIEYLQEENRVQKERMGGRRLRFTDAERRRLARKAQVVGRKELNELESLITPDTLLRWYRERCRRIIWTIREAVSTSRTSISVAKLPCSVKQPQSTSNDVVPIIWTM